MRVKQGMSVALVSDQKQENCDSLTSPHPIVCLSHTLERFHWLHLGGSKEATEVGCHAAWVGSINGVLLRTAI